MKKNTIATNTIIGNISAIVITLLLSSIFLPNWYLITSILSCRDKNDNMIKNIIILKFKLFYLAILKSLYFLEILKVFLKHFLNSRS